MSDRNRAGILARRLILRVADPHEATAVAGAQAVSAVTAACPVQGVILLWGFGHWGVEPFGEDDVELVTPTMATFSWGPGGGAWGRSYWA